MPDQRVLILGGCGHTGSALLTHLLSKNIAAESVDLGLRGIPVGLHKHNTLKDYRVLGSRYLQEFSHVVLLAGHSSVLACDGAPDNAADSLVVGLRRLWTSMRPDQRLVFASSASVLCGAGQARLYDRLMRAREELLLAMFPGRAIGLRFGTVCGASPNIRRELMLNGMVWSAVEKKKITVSNAGAFRPVLAMNDLLRAFDRILDGYVPYGAAYNLCSFNDTIGSLADRVAFILKVPVVSVQGVPTYDFSMPCSPEFNVVRQETVDTIVESLVAHYKAAETITKITIVDQGLAYEDRAPVRISFIEGPKPR